MIYVSPSQIKIKRDCFRKWAFRYIDGIVAPTTPKQQFGSDVHKELELWQTESKPPGPVASQALKPEYGLPVPGTPNVFVEYKKPGGFQIPIGKDAVLMGYIDLVQVLLHEVVVTDYKTTSDLRWAMTAEELAEDPQGVIYAVAGMLIFQRPVARCQWLYLSATNPKNGPRRPNGSRKVEHVFTIDNATRSFIEELDRIESDVADIIKAKNTVRQALDVKDDRSACQKYGGCPFLSRCGEPDPVDVLAAMIEQENRRNSN